MTDTKELIERAWNCDDWPDWLNKIVDEVNSAADEHNMSSEQAFAYAVLIALRLSDSNLRAVQAELARLQDEKSRATIAAKMDAGGETVEVAISPSDPLTIIEGIEQFGLAADGSDLRDLRAALSTPDGWQSMETATHRHKKRGSEYILIGIGRMQSADWRDLGTPADNCPHGVSINMREVAIYRSVDDGSLWVRPREEFEDGRFSVLAAAPQEDKIGRSVPDHASGPR